MVRPFVAGNWKMNTTVEEAMRLASSLRYSLEGLQESTVVLCPPFVSLDRVSGVLKGSVLKIGAQDVYYEEKGAFTGEVSTAMLRDLCEYVLLGHSERRLLFGETDELVNRKLHKVMDSGLNPILCVGEKLDQRQEGREEQVVRESLLSCLEGLNNCKGLVIAYEPVWAIGTGLAATGEQSEAVLGFIRELLLQRFGSDSMNVPLLYGGSVTPENISEFVSQQNVDGALVGGASLDANQFQSIVRTVAKTNFNA